MGRKRHRNKQKLRFIRQTSTFNTFKGRYFLRDQGLHGVIPAQAGIQEGRLGVAKQFFVYIMASRRNGTLYVEVTSNLVQRVWHHKQDLVEGFTRRYGVKMLVYFEAHENAASAIIREKQLKKWERDWKIRLIEQSNPEWRDLYSTICI